MRVFPEIVEFFAARFWLLYIVIRIITIEKYTHGNYALSIHTFKTQLRKAMKPEEMQIPFNQAYPFELPDVLCKLSKEGWRRWVTQ